jgi:hypothetical protein
MAHRVVWTYFNGPIPDGLQINHKDTRKQNNKPLNLEPVTGAENILHSYRNGRPHPWHKPTSTRWRGKQRLTAEQTAEARAMRNGGALLRDIAVHFGIGTSHAHRITS